MPLWDFHLAPGVLSFDEKDQLSKAITKIYTRMGLPAFYVQVRFTEGSSSMFISGESTSKFVSIQIYHVARNIPNPQEGEKFLVKIDSVLTPIFGPKGVQWEYWITESDRALWKINGIYPPPTGSEMEKQWFKADAPVLEVEGKSSRL